MSIGIFDSGVGGLSIYQEVKKIFPENKVIYLSDKKNFPYGEKTEEELIKLCSNNINFLSEKSVDLIVIACNSATVATIQKLRKLYDIPLIGVEPAIKVAVGSTKNGRVGLVATSQTVTSHDGKKWLKEGQGLFRTHQGKMVDLIENNFVKINETDLEKFISKLLIKEVDVIVLGCTHYHFIKDRLENRFSGIKFLAPGKEVAGRVEEIVDTKKIKLENGKDEFYTNGSANELKSFIENVLNIEAADVREI